MMVGLRDRDLYKDLYGDVDRRRVGRDERMLYGAEDWEYALMGVLDYLERREREKRLRERVGDLLALEKEVDKELRKQKEKEKVMDLVEEGLRRGVVFPKEFLDRYELGELADIQIPERPVRDDLVQRLFEADVLQRAIEERRYSPEVLKHLGVYVPEDISPEEEWKKKFELERLREEARKREEEEEWKRKMELERLRREAEMARLREMRALEERKEREKMKMKAEEEKRKRIIRRNELEELYKTHFAIAQRQGLSIDEYAAQDEVFSAQLATLRALWKEFGMSPAFRKWGEERGIVKPKPKVETKKKKRAGEIYLEKLGVK